jgi:hypothetical protein
MASTTTDSEKLSGLIPGVFGEDSFLICTDQFIPILQGGKVVPNSGQTDVHIHQSAK